MSYFDTQIFLSTTGIVCNSHQVCQKDYSSEILKDTK